MDTEGALTVGVMVWVRINEGSRVRGPIAEIHDDDTITVRDYFFMNEETGYLWRVPAHSTTHMTPNQITRYWEDVEYHGLNDHPNTQT